MADTLVFLQLEHGGLLRMLRLVDSLCRALEKGEAIDGDLLALAIDYFRDFPDTCHHPKEDVVLRRLQLRDPVAAAGIIHVLADHEDLHAYTARLSEAVHRANERGALHAPALVQAVAGFVTLYREHLEDEDLHFFPTVRAHLLQEDWDLIDFTMFDQPDPLYDAQAESRFRVLRDIILDGTAREDRAAGGAGA